MKHYRYIIIDLTSGEVTVTNQKDYADHFVDLHDYTVFDTVNNVSLFQGVIEAKIIE